MSITDINLFNFFPLIKIDGIIGWPIIKNLKVIIDYKNATITITKPIKNDNLTRNFFYYYRPFVTMKTLRGEPIPLFRYRI